MTQNNNPDGKFKELILFICHRSLSDRKFETTKLNQLLFFADFAAYVRFGRSISGQEYQKRVHGPAPRSIVSAMKQLHAVGDLAESTHDYHGRTQVRDVALRDADMAALSAAEIAIVTEVLDEYRDKSGSDIRQMPHEFDAWKLAADGETIPYEMALAVPVAERESDKVIGPELANKLRQMRASA